MRGVRAAPQCYVHLDSGRAAFDITQRPTLSSAREEHSAPARYARAPLRHPRGAPRDSEFCEAKSQGVAGQRAPSSHHCREVSERDPGICSTCAPLRARVARSRPTPDTPHPPTVISRDIEYMPALSSPLPGQRAAHQLEEMRTLCSSIPGAHQGRWNSCETHSQGVAGNRAPCPTTTQSHTHTLITAC